MNIFAGVQYVSSTYNAFFSIDNNLHDYHSIMKKTHSVLKMKTFFKKYQFVNTCTGNNLQSVR